MHSITNPVRAKQFHTRQSDRLRVCEGIVNPRVGSNVMGFAAAANLNTGQVWTPWRREIV